jgi:acylphosphatase
MAKRVHALVRGRVQNVGFRDFVQRRANSLGLTGWVRNVGNGRELELEAEGSEAALDDLLASVRKGPSAAHVESVSVSDKQAETSPTTGFLVR